MPGVAVGRVLAGASLLLGVASGLRTRGNPEVSPRPLVAHGVSLHCLFAVMSKLRQEASRIQASRDRLDLSASIHTWVRTSSPPTPHCLGGHALHSQIFRTFLENF